jgi:hypothetical protein
MNTSVAPPTATKGSTPPPPTATISKASDMKSTAATRKTSMSDLEKELQEFDIEDDVSDVENGQTTGVYKKTTDEDEVKTFT